MTKCLISYYCRNKLSEGVSYGMTLQDSPISFLKFVGKLKTEEYAILNVIHLTEEETAEISEQGLHL